jgi:hypothetical protein
VLGIAEEIVGPPRATGCAGRPRGGDRIAQLASGEAGRLGRRLGGVRATRAEGRQLVAQLALAQRPGRHLGLEPARTPVQLGEQVAELRGQPLGLLEMVVASRSRGAGL